MSKLSALSVKNAKAGFHADGDNLYLQVTPKGSKSWVCRYKINGRTRDMGLGSAKWISLAEARTAAHEAIALVRKGADPIELRRAHKKSVENGPDPKADETALYRHYDAENRLLYVGISLRAFRRLCQHQSGARWWLKITRVVIEQFGSKRAAEEAELQAIKTELPIYNRRHKPRVEIIGQHNQSATCG